MLLCKIVSYYKKKIKRKNIEFEIELFDQTNRQTLRYLIPPS